jgi:hypothetical protein
MGNGIVDNILSSMGREEHTDPLLYQKEEGIDYKATHWHWHWHWHWH